MNIIKCEKQHLDMVSDFYADVVEYLSSHINYPKWTSEYPCRKSVKCAIGKNEQYACIDDGAVVGAFILNDNPQGSYELGEWGQDLKNGEYLVIHTLAAAPDKSRRGIGGFMVDFCINKAKNDGFKAIRLDVVPDNIPAIQLYNRKGFTFAGEKDLQRGIDDIPVFGLYELNFKKS